MVLVGSEGFFDNITEGQVGALLAERLGGPQEACKRAWWQLRRSGAARALGQQVAKSLASAAKKNWVKPDDIMLVAGVVGKDTPLPLWTFFS